MAKVTYNSKRDRFVGLAQNRTNKLINSIRVLAHCSNKSLYEYKNDEIEKMFNAIREALDEARLKFKDKDKSKFTF